MMSLSELAERCETAIGADRALDAAIHVAVTTFEPRRAGVGWPDENEPLVPAFPGWQPLPRYTASLDAAMTLMPDGAILDLAQHAKDKWSVIFWDVEGPRCEAKTPALALCAAALRARAAQGMEAQRATTVKQGVVHDSPVREANAPNPPPIALPSEQPNDQ